MWALAVYQLLYTQVTKFDTLHIYQHVSYTCTAMWETWDPSQLQWIVLCTNIQVQEPTLLSWMTEVWKWKNEIQDQWDWGRLGGTRGRDRGQMLQPGRKFWRSLKTHDSWILPGEWKQEKWRILRWKLLVRCFAGLRQLSPHWFLVHVDIYEWHGLNNQHKDQ